MGGTPNDASHERPWLGIETYWNHSELGIHDSRNLPVISSCKGLPSCHQVFNPTLRRLTFETKAPLNPPFKDNMFSSQWFQDVPNICVIFLNHSFFCFWLRVFDAQHAPTPKNIFICRDSPSRKCHKISCSKGSHVVFDVPRSFQINHQDTNNSCCEKPYQINKTFYHEFNIRKNWL